MVLTAKSAVLKFVSIYRVNQTTISVTRRSHWKWANNPQQPHSGARGNSMNKNNFTAESSALWIDRDKLRRDKLRNVSNCIVTHMYQRIKHFIIFRIFNWCPFCGRCHLPWNVKRRRLNTLYADDKQNYMTSCKSVYEDTIAYYQERWEDYHSSIL